MGKHVLFSERFAKMAAPVNHEEMKWAQDWLAQHIKNTDFGYRGHLKHDVPEPYVWDKTFATDYTRLDEEQFRLPFSNAILQREPCRIWDFLKSQSNERRRESSPWKGWYLRKYGRSIRISERFSRGILQDQHQHH